MMARMAEASSTTLFEFTLGSLTPFGDQLVDQGNAGLEILPSMPLSALDSALHRSDANFIFFPSQNNFVARVDSQRSAEFRRNHHASILVHLKPDFRRKNNWLWACHGRIIAKCHICT